MPHDYAEVRRPGPQMLSQDERHSLHGFQEVELAYDERTIQEECKRCLRCDLDWLEKIRLEPLGLEPIEQELVTIDMGVRVQPPTLEKRLAVERSQA